MPREPGDTSVEELERERDLYRSVLELGSHEDAEGFLGELLKLLVQLTSAARGYIELYGPEGPAAGARWSVSQGCDDEEVAAIRAILSLGIVASAIGDGLTVLTPSAMLDPRFRERRSVREASIEAVLCAPIGREPVLGVVYLQSRPGAQPFQERDRARVEVVARHIAPLCDRLLVRARLQFGDDPTRPWRERLRVEGVVGRSRALARVLEEAAGAAALRDVNVLLTGESGTGKTQLARVIHDNSARAAGPFVEVNAAAIPEALVESELFGAVAGAHSTAVRDVEGKVAAATGGTLFLDEIGDLPLPVQAKLLQLLHSREYFPLGSARLRRADIRIIAATNGDLAAAVQAGRFREDLYYRLDVLRIRMPRLAERREDLPALAHYLCDEACRRNGLAGLRLSSAAVAALETAEWPGNVRQLASSVERGVARASALGSDLVEVRHLFGGSADDGGDAGAVTWQEATRRFQRELLVRTLEEAGGNVTEAARRLGLVRSYVYTMLNAFGLGRGGDRS